MEEITFEQLPKAVTDLQNTVNNIERLLLEKSNEPQQPEPDRWFDLSEVCEYLPDKPAKATVYGWVNHSTIPVHKGSKKLRFLKSEIDTWLMQGRRKTIAELGTEAESYIKKNGGKV